MPFIKLMLRYTRAIKRGFASKVPLDRAHLEKHGIFARLVERNLITAKYYERSIATPPANPGTAPSAFTNTGAYAAYTGEKTSRSPLDKRIVAPNSKEVDQKIRWSDYNVKMDYETFDRNLERAVDYLNNRSELFCVDGFAGWDPKYRKAIRVFCTRPYHAMLADNLLVRPHTEELRNCFTNPDLVIYNAGEFYSRVGTTSTVCLP
jgi:phosphoenolpyruvate carboxykinase (ATP)